MIITPNILLAIKYIAAIMILIAIIIAPSYLASQTKKDAGPTGYIRLGSWLFGWTGIGWLLALIWATQE